MAIYLADIEPRDADATTDESPERRRRDPEATRQAILDAAETLFVSHGPATSLSQIAKQADVTKSLIHHHFGSKDELWQNVQERHFTEYFELQMSMLEAADDPDTHLLEQSTVTFFRFLQRNPDRVRFMTWTVAASSDACPSDHEKQLYELGIQRIQEAQQRGKVRADLEPFFVIKMLIGMPFAWHQTRDETLALIDSEVDSEALDELFLRDMMKVFLDGVRPRADVTSDD